MEEGFFTPLVPVVVRKVECYLITFLVAQDSMPYINDLSAEFPKYLLLFLTVSTYETAGKFLTWCPLHYHTFHAWKMLTKF